MYLGSTTFNAADIVDLTLIAKTSVNILSQPMDNSPVLFTVNAGQTIGVVDSYFLPTSGRSTIYWSFKDANGTYYYVAHKEGEFDTSNIQNQGVQTLEQKKADADAAALLASQGPLIYYGKKVLIWGGIGLGVVLLAKELIKDSIQSKKATA